MLGSAVGEVEGVIIGDLGGSGGRAPRGIEAADEMATVKRVVQVDLLARLLVWWYPRVEEPAIRLPPEPQARGSVDVHGGVERQAAVLVQHHAEVVVGQHMARLTGGQAVDRGERHERW